jgi:Predicted SPOUT methyltransferase
MRLLRVCVGRSKAGTERDLAARFVERAAAACHAIGFPGAEPREAGAGENRDAARTVWIFGLRIVHTLQVAMTWPRQLLRIMAAEEIYRTMTILSGHPYHCH